MQSLDECLIIKSRFVILILRILMTDRINQIRAKNANFHQNILSSAALISFSLTLHSNFHLYSPSSSKSTHHRNPTISRPQTFLTIQKSITAKTITSYFQKIPHLSKASTNKGQLFLFLIQYAVKIVLGDC